MRLLLVALLLTSVAGCSKSPPPAPAAPPAPASPATGPHFVEDDFFGAVATARAEGKVVFVDAWAPWCHTCLSMQQEVLSKPALAEYADRVVFVAVDTDRPENAGFLEKLTVKMWPTFFVVAPDGANDGMRQLGVHPGSMDLEETKRFLDDGVRLARAAVVDGPERQLLDAHAAFAKGDVAAAVAGYEAASSTSWPRRTEAILGGMRALSSSRDFAGCVKLGTTHLRDVDRGGAPGDLAAGLLSCAERGGDAAAIKATRLLVRDRLVELSTTPPPGSAVDDRADVLATLADVQEAIGDADAAAAIKSTHTKRLALLEEAAAQATSPKQAQVHDYARLNSLLALDRGNDAVALFQQRVKELPDDYEPWARLASTLYRLKRAAEATPAIEQAIRLSYGTRRLRYRLLAADNAKLLGDVEAEREALQALLQEAASLPPALRDETMSSSARTRLEDLPASGVAASP